MKSPDWVTEIGQHIIVDAHFESRPIFSDLLAIWQALVDADRRWSKLREAWTSALVSAHIQAAHP